MRRSINALAAVAALALTMAGCASGKDTGLPAGPTTAPPGKTCSGTVDMVNLTFEPKDCTVPVGTTVKWVNKVGGLPHTVTAVDEKLFDSGLANTIDANEEYTFTFKTAGEFAYYCRLHSTDKKAGMVGTIKVEASSGGGSPSPTSS